METFDDISFHLDLEAQTRGVNYNMDHVIHTSNASQQGEKPKS